MFRFFWVNCVIFITAVLLTVNFIPAQTSESENPEGLATSLNKSYERTLTLEEGLEHSNGITPFDYRSMMLRSQDSRSNCWRCSSPCSNYACCNDGYPQCCLVNGAYCMCCSH